MTEQHEQQYCIKFCQKLGDTQVETIRKIQQAFGDDAMSNSRIKEWYNHFKDGSISVDSEPCSGRPSTSRNENVIEQVRTLVMEDHRITVRELANETVHSILTEDLGMRRVFAKFIPKLLTMEQKQCRLEIAQDVLDNANSNANFLNTVITGDESWVYVYDPETKMQSSRWKHPTSPEAKKSTAGLQQCEGHVGHFLQLLVLHRLRDAVRRKRLDLWAANTWQLHHVIAPAHSAHLIQTFIAKHNIPVVRQAPYSPNMAPCEFWLFPKLKMPLKGTQFESREDIMRNATVRLITIPIDAFQKCFQQWEKCVHYQGDYFEGD
ncbi:hypothetical protein B7P43_G06641 [Cryptotermes secundus]|uniref:Mos1 transposase HTH domain-containing protein n=1 Tax=Cryptotermes secundus TaxID=105785 RepID=A0A2J7QI30_9NEOP|nr:hypothetical protein B7P43_G06641 [Cryptotermes secundus]